MAKKEIVKEPKDPMSILVDQNILLVSIMNDIKKANEYLKIIARMKLDEHGVQYDDK